MRTEREGQRMVTTLLSQVGRYKGASIATPALIALEVLMDVLIPYVTASLIDKGINASDMNSVYRYGLIMIGMALLSLTFGVAAGATSAYASSGFAANLRSAMISNIQRFAFSNIDHFSQPGLVTRMTVDVNNLQQAYQQILRITVRAPLRLVLSIVMCIVIDPGLSVIFLAAMAVLAAVIITVIGKASRLFTKVFEAYDRLNLSVEENVSAIRVVKAFVREDYENEKFTAAARCLYRLNSRAERLMAVNNPVMNLVVYGSIIALAWLGARAVVGGTLTTGELTSLFTYIMSIMMSLMMLSMIFFMLTQSAASGRRVAEVIDERPDMENGESPLTAVTDGSIVFKHVTFRYKDRSDRSALVGEAAVTDLSLTVAAGETIGIIGGTGSGKSTAVNLIARLYDVSEGSVLVGGHDVRDYDLHTLRHAVAMVPQQSTLFSGTVIDNLRWGRADATEEECREACHRAAIDMDGTTTPLTLTTMITQGGANLSGGQRQRLCIARALLKRPAILILDDATSACDTATDALIRERIADMDYHPTMIVISQRVATISRQHRVLVLDGGRLSGFDSHEKLLKSNALYRDICRLQETGCADFDEKGPTTKRQLI